MKNKTKNKIIKKGKGRKTKKRQMKGGGLLDYFTTMSVRIPGFGSVGKCQDKPIWNWKTKQNDIQKCYMVDGNKVYKTVQNTSDSNTPWYQFW